MTPIIRLSRDCKATCCGNILKAGTEIMEMKRIGARKVMIVTLEGHVHKIKMREKSDAVIAHNPSQMS
jgi:hypothetical protein